MKTKACQQVLTSNEIFTETPSEVSNRQSFVKFYSVLLLFNIFVINLFICQLMPTKSK